MPEDKQPDVCGMASYVIRSAVAESYEILYGQSRSVYRGQGFEYVDFRPYIYGDDIRYVDWRISARYLTNPFTVDLYVREYIAETKVDTLMILDLHRSLLYWDKLYTLLYATTLMLSLAYKLGDDVSYVILLGGREIVVPSRDPREILEYVRSRICSIGGEGFPDETGLSRAAWIIASVKKIRGVAVFTDYAVKPEYFMMLSRILKSINAGFAVVAATHRYELYPPVEDGILYLHGIRRGSRLRIKDAYRGIRRHVSMVKASILSGTRLFLELRGLDDARDNKLRILRGYMGVRQRQVVV